ncbi:UNVERIFIED_CONTAM: hypothetical protein GTU68_003125 [Idotea baltica]|nr:hypothetical protein [Idotea baltica]
MKKEIIKSDNAPAPIGPYSQAVKVGHMVFLSGQVALDPATGELHMDSIEIETKQVMKNLEAVLVAAGSSFDQVVKSSIFLSSMNLFAEVNDIYATYFEGEAPARETVAVKTLPKNVNVEISMIALVS